MTPVDVAMATSDRSTHYTGGANGYVDYPIWSGDHSPYGAKAQSA